MTKDEGMTNSEARMESGYRFDVDISANEISAFDIRASFDIRHSSFTPSYFFPSLRCRWKNSVRIPPQRSANTPESVTGR